MYNMNKKLQTTIVSLISVIGLILFDQWTKGLAVAGLKGSEAFVLIPGIFELNYTENRGAAFGLMQNQRIFFLIITAIVLIGVVYLFFRMPFKRFYGPLRAILVIFTAGTIGNLIDRMFLGYVVDFFYIRLIDFPVFNVADVFITGSLTVFVLLILLKYKEEDLTFIPGMAVKKKSDSGSAEENTETFSNKDDCL